MLLNLLNLYSLIFALFSKIEGMGKDLDLLKPTLQMNVTNISNDTLRFSESLMQQVPTNCIEVVVPCGQCTYQDNQLTMNTIENDKTKTANHIDFPIISNLMRAQKALHSDETTLQKHNNENLMAANSEKYQENIETTSINYNKLLEEEITKIKNLTKQINLTVQYTDEDTNDYDYSFDNYTSTKSDTTVITSSFKQHDFDKHHRFTEAEYLSTTDYFTYTTESTNENTDINEKNTSDITTEITANYSTTEFSETNNRTSYKDISNEVENVTYYSTTDTIDEIQSTDITFLTTNSKTQTKLPGTKSEVKTTDFVTIETNVPYTTKDTNQETTPILFDISRVTETTSESALYDAKRSTLPLLPDTARSCPYLSFNCSLSCGTRNITQVFTVSNCTLERVCYEKKCEVYVEANYVNKNKTNITKMVDIAYIDDHNIKQYNLTLQTQKKLLKLCWETMFGQELVKLTMMDLVNMTANFYNFIIVDHE